MSIAWLLYGSLEERTGGTIYDRIIVEGLRAGGARVDVLDPRGTPLRRLLAANVIVGDELCFRELAFVFPRMPGARRVLLMHHLTCWEEGQERARLREMQALRAADQIVTTSHATRARLEREGVRTSIDVVRPGCDRLVRSERAPHDATVRFLFVGAVTARKRVRELVVALPGDSELRVIGSLARERRYAEMVQGLARAREKEGVTISFTGEVDDAELARELAAADALVMPSSLEGYGIAATEAIHAGLPVIAARTPGLEEALAPAGDAVVFFDLARTDSDAFARTLHDFSTRRDRMRAATRLATLPTWAEAVREFQRLTERPRT